MDFKTFLEKIKEHGFGVVSFNTYEMHGWMWCFLMIATKGNHGTFFKQECRLDDFEVMLESMILNIEVLFIDVKETDIRRTRKQGNATVLTVTGFLELNKFYELNKGNTNVVIKNVEMKIL